MNLYKLDKVSKIYQIQNKKSYVLNQIDLEINEGEFVVILGPSGSGKSTLLNLLYGIDTASEGKVYFKNVELNELTDSELTEYRGEYLGFIFQNYNLIANLTVKENIELGKQLSNNPLSVTEMIKSVGLESHKNKYPYQLSGGQMQRVAIARALVKNPTVLFCDEPTGALDEKTGKQILKILESMHKKYHTTMIIVTHNPSIAQMANTVIRMNSGHIVEIIHNKTFKSADELRWA